MTATIVVIGPSACGKSTLARALAEELGWKFVEGDDHHSAENRAKMAAGVSLDDADREPFLDSIGRQLAGCRGGVVASCSALRRAYRDRLREYCENILFVWIDVDRDELARRLRMRSDHFMPSSLLQSQLASFEPPSAGERFVKVDGALPTHSQVNAIRQWLLGSKP